MIPRNVAALMYNEKDSLEELWRRDRFNHVLKQLVGIDEFTSGRLHCAVFSHRNWLTTIAIIALCTTAHISKWFTPL